MSYELRFSAYAGLSYHFTGDNDRAGVRREAAAYIRSERSRGRSATILTRGQEWEFETPEDADAISDNDGVLYIQEVEK